MAYAETRKTDFNQDALDQPPKGFEFGHTAGVGKPGKWIVQADGTNKVLAQTDRRFDPLTLPSRGAGRCHSGRCGSVRPLQARLGTSRSGGGSGLALPERGQLLHRSRECARRQRGALQGRERQADGSSRSRVKAELTARRRSARRASGARCGLWRTGRCSRSTSTAEAVRGRRHDVHAAWQGRRLDEGRLRHAVRRPDGRDEVGHDGFDVAPARRSALHCRSRSARRVPVARTRQQRGARSVTIYVSTDRVFSSRCCASTSGDPA